MEKGEVRSSQTSFVLLERYRGGDDTAAAVIFTRYFERLTSLARSRLSSRLARRTDPEDVVLSVYRSFFVDARAGRFTLTRGGDLWRLLAAMTKHKLLRQVRHHSADCRSMDLELTFDPPDSEAQAVCGHEPSAEDALALADELEWVFAKLDTVEGRVLELRMQGASHSEIARDIGRSERTVRRIVGEIRELMARRMDDA